MERLKRITLDYSLKNIPIPSVSEYRKRLIEKVESLLKRMRWRAFFYLSGSNDSAPTECDDDDDHFGFPSRRCPPQVDELIPFEEDMVRLVESIEFRKVSDKFQERLRADICKFRDSGEIIIRADKTKNLYSVPEQRYEKILRENVTKHYKIAPDSLYSDINLEAQSIADRLDLGDRVETLARKEAYVTLKDHKPNFEHALPCRLINPAKSELGVVSKRILDGIVGKLRACTGINLWKNTAAVINWFDSIKGRTDHTFLCFDIVDFYPSISESLLKDALAFAKQYLDILDEDIEIILHTRKSLLFSQGRAWMKRDKDGLFDVSMGSFDGAEICELVGAFLLNKLAESIDKDSIGLYRDDGLAVIRGSGHVVDATRKGIIGVFKQYGLRITIEANLSVVNYLDVTFDLSTGQYCPYRKPNDQPMYIDTRSNHPPQIIRNIPTAISKRISAISSDEQVFREAAPMYDAALAASGYQEKLRYVEESSSSPPRKTRQRRRNITWFNPPFSKNVATNVGRSFLRLIDKHFPKSSKLNRIFNKNTLKISYCCMPNMASLIRGSNNRKCHPQEDSTEKSCNCRHRENCPLEGKCQARSIVYKATVTNNATGSEKDYIGLTEPPFKLRHANHMTSFRHEKYASRTELSKHVWGMKQRQEDFTVKWSILEKARAYSNTTKRCNLCISEKLQIITAEKSRRLNSRCEIVSKCRHANKFTISNFSPNG